MEKGNSKVIIMRGNSRVINFMVRGNILILMEMNMRGNSRVINFIVRGNILILTETSM